VLVVEVDVIDPPDLAVLGDDAVADQVFRSYADAVRDGRVSPPNYL
jgi:hypothetical protein